jgi:hypothetical protein
MPKIFGSKYHAKNFWQQVSCQKFLAASIMPKIFVSKYHAKNFCQ